MLQSILAGGEDCHRIAEVLETLVLAKQTADAQGGAQRALASEVASLVEVLIDEAQGVLVVAQGRMQERGLRPPWRRSGICESVSGGQALDSFKISQGALQIALPGANACAHTQWLCSCPVPAGLL
jgi:hypothetical protein